LPSPSGLGRSKPDPVYDLEFDDALNAAIKLMDDPNYPQLLSSAKSVKELVEAEKATAKQEAPAKAGGLALPAPQPKN